MTQASEVQGRTRHRRQSRHDAPGTAPPTRPADASDGSERWRAGAPKPADLTSRAPAPPPGQRAPAAVAESSESPDDVQHVEIMGIRVDDVDLDLVVDHLTDALANGRGGWVVTPNVDILRQLVADPGLAELAARADLSLPDGMPLVWASRLQGTPLRARVAGSELLYPLCRRAASEKRRVFLLGGAPGVAARCAEILTEDVENLVISGTEAPAPGFEDDPAAVAGIIDHLKRSRPDLVFCAFGFPKQERLMANLVLSFPSTWFVGCGGSLDMACGDAPPAPEWMRRSGLEWLHRLQLEPQRLVHRYLVDDIPFALRLLASSLRHRRSHRHLRARHGGPRRTVGGRGRVPLAT